MVVLSSGVAAVETEPVEVFPGGAMVDILSEPDMLSVADTLSVPDMLSVPVRETVSGGETVNIQPAALSKIISNVIVNAKNKLCMFMFIRQHLV